MVFKKSTDRVSAKENDKSSEKKGAGRPAGTGQKGGIKKRN